MAIIYTYPTVTPSLADKVLISGADNKTENATITSILNLLPPQVDSFTSTFGTFISGTNNSSSTGNVSIGTVDLSAAGTPSSTNFLRGNNTWSSVSLTTDITGILPIINGGTGSSSTTYCDLQVNVTGTLPVGNGGTGLTSVSTLLNSNVNYSSDGSGTLPIANGGTGQTSANAALNALLPDQSAASGKYLKSDGTDVSWDAPSGSGTITGSGAVASYTLFRGTSSIGDAPMIVDNATNPTVSTHTGNFINTGTFSNTGNFTIKGETTTLIPAGPGSPSSTLTLGASVSNNDAGPKIVLKVSGIAAPPQPTRGSYIITTPTAMTSGEESNRTWTLPASLATNGQVLSCKGVTTVGADSDYELDWIDSTNIYDSDGTLSGDRTVEFGSTGTNTLWFKGAGDGTGTVFRISPRVRVDNNVDLRGGQINLKQQETTTTEGGAITLDFDTGNTQFVTNTTNPNVALNIGVPLNPKKGATYRIIVTNTNSAPSAFQMNAAFQFPSSGSPSYTAQATRKDMYICYCIEDTSGSEEFLCQQFLDYGN